MNVNPLLAGLRPTHPGEVLREDVLPALGRSKVEIAGLLGISRRQLYHILDEEQPVTPQMALRIGKLTGTTPESWLAMQMAYDLRAARKAIANDLASIPTLDAEEIG
jgi:addiction module HigA family antidote